MPGLDDSKIIELFYARSEQAIVELSQKYGSVCSKIANNILNNKLDAEECVNDAYLGAWNTIPPQNPNPLLTYISRIVRNLSIKKYHSNTSVKRNSFYDVALRFGFVIIDPDRRGQGYGKKMLQLGLVYAKDIFGAKKVSLGVFENNELAYYCYKAAGFQDVLLDEVEKYTVLGEEWRCLELEIQL